MVNGTCTRPDRRGPGQGLAVDPGSRASRHLAPATAAPTVGC